MKLATRAHVFEQRYVVLPAARMITGPQGGGHVSEDPKKMFYVSPPLAGAGATIRISTQGDVTSGGPVPEPLPTICGALTRSARDSCRTDLARAFDKLVVVHCSGSSAPGQMLPTSASTAVSKLARPSRIRGHQGKAAMRNRRRQWASSGYGHRRGNRRAVQSTTRQGNTSRWSTASSPAGQSHRRDDHHQVAAGTRGVVSDRHACATRPEGGRAHSQ